MFFNCSNKGQKQKTLINDSSQKYEEVINELLSKMTLEEKIRQINLRGTSSRAKSLSDELKQGLRDGKVGVMASEKINGKDIGTTWIAPFKLNTNGALKDGENTIEVEVVNV